MSANVGTELSICERNRHVSPCSISKPDLFETAQEVWVPKHLRPPKYLFLYAFSLTLNRLGDQFNPPLWIFQRCVSKRNGGVLVFCDF